MKVASKYVRRYGLNSDPVIDAIGNRDWKTVDPHGGYKKKKNGLLSKLFAAYEKSSGTNLSTFRKMMSGTYRDAGNRSDAVATTDWVNRHEDFFMIARWRPIYDASSKELVINNNLQGGIVGGKDTSADFVKKIVVGKRYKALISLWGVEIAVLEGAVVYPERTIWGTCIFDGYNSFCISVDIHPISGKIRVFAINEATKKDVSVNCKLLRIDESA